MKCTVISCPSPSALQILSRKVYDRGLQSCIKAEPPDAVGICQGTVLEIIQAGDIAEKAAEVTAAELGGSCPQHMTCLAIFGSTSAVNAAVEAIRTSLGSL